MLTPDVVSMLSAVAERESVIGFRLMDVQHTDDGIETYPFGSLDAPDEVGVYALVEVPHLNGGVEDRWIEDYPAAATALLAAGEMHKWLAAREEEV